MTTLTREMIEAMEAGPEMDRLVAERVMGASFAENCGQIAQLAHESVYVVPWHVDPSAHNRAYRKGLSNDVEWRPSTDIAPAWEVEQQFSGGPFNAKGETYLLNLMDVLGITCWATTAPPGMNHVQAIKFDDLFRLVNASPLDRCRAALLTTLTD